VWSGGWGRGVSGGGVRETGETSEKSGGTDE